MRKEYIDIKDLSDSREVLEAKSPKAITIFIVMILLVLIIGLTWCTFGKIDTYAKATGEIRTEEISSSLSSLSTGKITSIQALDGDKVSKDNVILTIDSDYYENQKEITSKQIEERKTKIDDYNLLIKSINNDRNYLNKNSSLYYEYENYALDLKETLESIDDSNDQISSSIEEYDLLISQNNKSKNELNSLINEYNLLINCVNNDVPYTGTNQSVLNTYNSYLSIYTPLKTIKDTLEPKITSGTATPEEIEQYNTALSNINSLNTSTINDINKAITESNFQVSTYDSNIESYKLKKDALSYKGNKEDSKQKLKNSYYISINNAIESLNNEIIALDNDLSKLDETLDSLSIKATSDGLLVYSKEYTIGDMITANELVASIVPDSNFYKVILLLPESKIAEVNVGQDVEYVISSLSMTDYGKPKGKVESISADSFSEQTSGTKFYKVTATIDKTVLTNKKDGQIRNLKVGMLIEGHIITGSQTIMSYLLDKLNFR